MADNETIAQQAMALLCDNLSLDALVPMVPNPGRRWWQWWRPRMVPKVKPYFYAKGEPIKFRRPPTIKVRVDG